MTKAPFALVAGFAMAFFGSMPPAACPAIAREGRGIAHGALRGETDELCSQHGKLAARIPLMSS